MLTVSVVFPTPPLWLKRAILFALCRFVAFMIRFASADYFSFVDLRDFLRGLILSIAALAASLSGNA